MKVLLLTGAGFCVPLGLPITTGFNDQINSIPSDLKLLIDENLKSSSNDIEKVLAIVEEFMSELGLINTLFKQRVSLRDSNYTVVNNDISRLRILAKTSVSNIKKSIYDILSRFDLKKTDALYKSILTEIKKLDKEVSLSFFTTNYDLTFENFIFNNINFLNHELLINDIEFGFSFTLGRNIFDPYRKYDWRSDVIEFQKLHGSLDWIKDNAGNCTKAGASLTPDTPDDTPILYPGYKGTPSNEPFITIHDNFSKKLSSADVILIIGFAFRDPYLNNLFENFLRSSNNIPVLCFYPCKPEHFPVDSRIPHYLKTFSNFNLIQKGVELEANSLRLQETLKNIVQEINFEVTGAVPHASTLQS